MLVVGVVFLLSRYFLFNYFLPYEDVFSFSAMRLASRNASVENKKNTNLVPCLVERACVVGVRTWSGHESIPATTDRGSIYPFREPQRDQTSQRPAPNPRLLRCVTSKVSVTTSCPNPRLLGCMLQQSLGDHELPGITSRDPTVPTRPSGANGRKL